MIGTTLLHYRIDGQIGAGGMGIVYKATDTRLGRSVAVKVLPSGAGTDADRIRRFTQEARAASRLNHPNIITIYDIASVAGMECIVMEYVPGRTLAASILNGGLEWTAAIDCAVQIASALAAAHSAGIVHRDLKPANVMLSDSGQVKVLDFGLAKLNENHLRDSAVSTQSLPGVVMGTAAYMSPEQAQGEPIDARSDIFSFGAMLYEMLTGRQAFAGSSLISTLSAVLRDEPPPLVELNSQTPVEVEEIVNRCLRKDRTERFQSMTEVAEALNRARRLTSTSETGASVAVLPFANLSIDQENEFLADGISEDLIMALSRVPGLRVPARTSCFAFKGKNEDIRRIGRTLNVETVLEGSVRKVGNKLRVTAQLVKVCDGFHLWSERYDREMKDVFDIQDDITRAIVDALEVQLGSGPETRFVHQQTANTEAYELYTKGRYYWNQRGPALKKALHYFELALLEDPDYALALTGLADSLGMLAYYDFEPSLQVMPRAQAAAERAVRLAPSLAEAYAALGWVQTMYCWNWTEADRCYRRAIELNPKYAHAQFWHAAALAALGCPEEALAAGKRALALDPLSPVMAGGLGWWYVAAKQYEKGIAHCQGVIDRWPQAGIAYLPLSECLLLTGRREEAVAAAERGASVMGRPPIALNRLGAALAHAGRRDEALAVLAELQDQPSPWVRSYYSIAFVQLALSDRLAALSSFEQAAAERDCELPWAFNWPTCEELQSDPAFQKLQRIVGLA